MRIVWQVYITSKRWTEDTKRQVEAVLEDHTPITYKKTRKMHYTYSLIGYILNVNRLFSLYSIGIQYHNTLVLANKKKVSCVKKLLKVSVQPLTAPSLNVIKLKFK